MPKTGSIRTAANNSTCHLASAARQSASYSELPFKGMDGPRDPFLVSIALNVHQLCPRAEWIRVKHLSNGRIIIAIKATGMKVYAKGYSSSNAQLNLITKIFRFPDLWKAIK